MLTCVKYFLVLDPAALAAALARPFFTLLDIMPESGSEPSNIGFSAIDTLRNEYVLHIKL